MLSPNEREILNDLIKKISKSNRLIQLLEACLTAFTHKIVDENKADKNTSLFSDSEVERLMTLNRSLSEIEIFKRDIGLGLWPKLISKIQNPNDLMGDFEIDTKIDFVLREDDPEAREDSDNILTTRTDSIFFAMILRLAMKSITANQSTARNNLPQNRTAMHFTTCMTIAMA
jgi:hypothetical protein